MFTRLAVAEFNGQTAVFAVRVICGAFVLPGKRVFALLAGDLALANLNAFVAMVADSIG